MLQQQGECNSRGVLCVWCLQSCHVVQIKVKFRWLNHLRISSIYWLLWTGCCTAVSTLPEDSNCFFIWPHDPLTPIYTSTFFNDDASPFYLTLTQIHTVCSLGYSHPTGTHDLSLTTMNSTFSQQWVGTHHSNFYECFVCVRCQWSFHRLQPSQVKRPTCRWRPCHVLCVVWAPSTRAFSSRSLGRLWMQIR